ncbi:cdkn1a interacting zinc finger protein 1b isoform X1 [Gadus morhua]|nr:cip1-interacting zinc finger protein-like isoform X1 [Gadus morhua]
MKRQRKADRRSLRQAGPQAKRGSPRVQCAVSSLIKQQLVAEQVSDMKTLSGGLVGQHLQELEDVSVTHKPDSSGPSVSSTNAERLPQSCDHLGDGQTHATTDNALVSMGDAVSIPDQKEVVETPELQGLGSSLKVTIQRESDSRAFGETAGQPEGQQQGQHHCHLCSSSCPSLQAFQNHMMGTEHQKRLKVVTEIVKTAGSRGDQPIKPRWCDTCQKHFSGDVILHRRTNPHKMCKQSSRPYCLVCKRHFRTPRKFVEHMKSPEHKQKVLLEEAQDDELITVDAIGCFEGEEGSGGEGSGWEGSGGEGSGREEVVAGEGDGNTRGGGEETFKGEETEKQDYDPDTVYGSSFVVPVTGFLCRLCQKFFDNEATARHTHCRTHTHYLNLQIHQTFGNDGNLTQEHTSSPQTSTAPNEEHKYT